MTEITAVIAIIGIFSLACLLVHYEALRGIWYLLPLVSVRPRQKILVVVCAAVVAHLVEVGLFAGAFWLFFAFDTPDPGGSIDFTQALYISIESYTSLGTASGFPVGLMRLLAGVEALVGLILIGWTASFTYIVMRQFWGEHPG